MPDRISEEHRSWNMSRIKSANTKPEIAVRKYLFSKGYRFRLNGRVSKRLYPKGVLPGKPDIILAKYKTVIFVHGCFWHMHEGCKNSNIPKSNTDFWMKKLKENVIRDSNNYEKLKALSWNVIVLWECEVESNIFQGKLEFNNNDRHFI